MKKLLVIFVIGLLCSISSAKQIDTVILTTTLNYPDAFVAAAAANKIGAPVLLTDVYSIPEETQDELDDLEPTTIYIIGGPVVVSSDVENALKAQGYNVIRIWGITRYGTSTEVAKYFWFEGAEKVVMVADTVGTPDDGNPNTTMLAKDLAIANDAPLIVSSKDVLPAMVKETLIYLNTQETMLVLVGDFSEDVKNELIELGIIIDEITGDEDTIGNKTRDRIKNKTREMNQTGTPLVIVAVGNWQDTINAPFVPGNGVSRLISSEDEIEDVIAEINAGDYTRIKVVGKPELAQQICDALAAEGIEHDCLTGKATQVAALIAKKEGARIEELRQKFEEKRSRILEKLREKSQWIDGECAQYFELVNSTVSGLEDGVGEQYKNRIQELKEIRAECENGLSEGNLTRRRDSMQQLKSEVKTLRWELREYISDEIQDETDTETKNTKEIAERLRERIQEIKEIRDEILAVDEKVAERCAEMVQEMEELENKGEYSRIQDRINVALQGCSNAQEKIKEKGKKDTTTIVELTTTTRRGQGDRP
ncbi:MAG: cell wall-binding repeat-containing protein [Candidatus Altiarchaeota archaeon]|nr:cell wall-binding repeat-containing protein [Candidatus Altiarchaeota archaeon]